MASYLQTYGQGDEQRSRRNRIIIWTVVGVIVVAILAYFVLHNLREKQVAKHFLADVNAHNYQAAYKDWCPTANSCPNYDYQRFLTDWGPSSKASTPWEITSTDSCKTFLTVNVEAKGAEMQSLAVERSDKILTFAPAPECQERKWRWKQFFQRLTGHAPKQQS